MQQDRSYVLPRASKPPRLGKRQVQLIANGDLRLSANQECWPEQAKMEEALAGAVADAGVRARPRAIRTRPTQRHGFIGSQKEGMEVFRTASTPTRRSSSPRRSGSTRTTCCTG